jgi:hypothetical protein
MQPGNLAHDRQPEATALFAITRHPVETLEYPLPDQCFGDLQVYGCCSGVSDRQTTRTSRPCRRASYMHRLTALAAWQGGQPGFARDDATLPVADRVIVCINLVSHQQPGGTVRKQYAMTGAVVHKLFRQRPAQCL